MSSSAALQLEALGDYLRVSAPIWRPRAFYGLPLAWEAALPEVVEFLEGLPASVDGAGDDTTWANDGPAVVAQWASRGAALGALSTFDRSPDSGLDSTHMSGRKAPQIGHFLGVVRPRLPADADRIVDWCAGKSHLGRSLAGAASLPLVALERNAALCEAGRALALASGVSAQFIDVDVLTSGTEDYLIGGAAAVALHACGDLHAALITSATCRFVAIAPCCYSRALLADGTARLLSAAAQAHVARGLTVDEADLRLVHERPSSTGRREQADVHRRQRFRLAFDAWHQAVRGASSYRPMPSFPPQWANEPFPEFCRRLAALGGMAPPTESDDMLAEFERAGAERHERVRRRDLIRSLFRGPLEAWLVLDRAAALEQRGYAVEVGTFCDREVTPRNALIVATRGRPSATALGP